MNVMREKESRVEDCRISPCGEKWIIFHFSECLLLSSGHALSIKYTALRHQYKQILAKN